MAYQADAGDLTIDGQLVGLRGPQRVRGLGISFGRQDLNLASNTRVRETTVLGGGTQLLPDCDWLAYAGRRDEAPVGPVGLDADPTMSIRDLKPTDQQLVAVARAMRRDPRTVVLDEPTAAKNSRQQPRCCMRSNSSALGSVADLRPNGKRETLAMLQDIWSVVTGEVRGNSSMSGTDLASASVFSAHLPAGRDFRGGGAGRSLVEKHPRQCRKVLTEDSDVSAWRVRCPPCRHARQTDVRSTPPTPYVSTLPTASLLRTTRSMRRGWINDEFALVRPRDRRCSRWKVRCPSPTHQPIHWSQLTGGGCGNVGPVLLRPRR